ncbi:hypothetical protein AN958_02798 [Leucoagaricus sp. SymC.cos]|nr:hypothetical protein AN958_02798 [Leucoagaricus sp. SymC.cos]
MDVLAMIGNWLEKTYQNDVKLSGLIWLHDIAGNRMGESPTRCLNMFNRLCGDTTMDHVVLVSTMWEKIQADEGVRRQRQLQEDFWKNLIEKGSRVDSLKKANKDEAWRIVDEVIRDHKQREAVLLQQELVDFKRKLSETEAGKMLYTSMQKQLAEQMDCLKTVMDKLEKAGDQKTKKILRQEHDRVEKEFQKTFRDVERKMKVPFGKRMFGTVFGRKKRTVSLYSAKRKSELSVALESRQVVTEVVESLCE